MKGKYNTGEAIDLKELSEEEAKEAIHEWAEGSEALEELLLEGYEKGFLSNACCAGEIEDEQLPYIDYLLNSEDSRKMAIGIAEKLVNSDLDCQVDVRNTFLKNKYMPEKYPTKEINRLTVYTRMDNGEEVFKAMTKFMREIEIENIELPEDSSQIPWKKIKEPKEDLTYDDEFFEEIEKRIKENFGQSTIDNDNISDTIKQKENSKTRLTGEEMIDGIVELGEEMGIRQGEISDSEAEINRTEREYQQPEQDYHYRGNRRGE